MESKDLKVVLIVGCLSLVASSYILGKSISTGLQYHGGYISSAGGQVAGAIANAAGNQQPLQTSSDVLNESQAAAFLQISNSQLSNLVANSNTKDGKGIPHFKIGGTVLFSKTALSKWVVTSAENGYEY